MSTEAYAEFETVSVTIKSEKDKGWMHEKDRQLHWGVLTNTLTCGLFVLNSYKCY